MKEDGTTADTLKEELELHARRMKKTCAEPESEHYDEHYKEEVRRRNEEDKVLLETLREDREEEGDEMFQKCFISREKLDKLIEALSSWFAEKISFKTRRISIFGQKIQF